MLIEYIYCVYIMKRYRVGFGRTDGTLVRIGVCLNANVSILGVRCTMTPSQLHTCLLLNYTGIRLCADPHSPAIQTHNNATAITHGTRLCANADVNGIHMLALR